MLPRKSEIYIRNLSVTNTSRGITCDLRLALKSMKLKARMLNEMRQVRVNYLNNQRLYSIKNMQLVKEELATRNVRDDNCYFINKIPMILAITPTCEITYEFPLFISSVQNVN